MNYSLLRITLGLLITVCLQVSGNPDGPEVVLINQLNTFFQFDHNIFLLDSSIEHSNYIGAPLTSKTGDGNYTPQNVYSFKLVNDNITGLENLKEIRSKNPFLIVVVGKSKIERNIRLFQHVQLIHRLNVRMKIGFFFSNIEFIENLEDLFYWYWKHGILNIFSAFHKTDNTQLQVMNVYKFDPFGGFKLINVTGKVIFGDYFPSQFSNFQQHQLRAPMVNSEMSDYDSKLWKTVLDNLNASFATIEAEGIGEGLPVFDTDKYDLIPHLQAVRKNLNIHIPLYPMGMDEMVIVVPQAPHFSDFMTYLIRVSSDHLFGYFFITVVVVTLLLTISRHLKTAKILFVQCAADVLNLLMNDNTSIKYRQLYRSDVCLIVPLTFAGFIIVNGVLSIFQSYVTLPVNQPQINTINDLYRSNYPILTTDKDWKSTVVEFLEQASGHGGWNDKIVVADLKEVNQQIILFNTSISFFTMRSGAKILLEVQKRLDIIGYHVPTEIYLVKTLLQYKANANFPYIERINPILDSLRQAGLYFKWRDEHDENIVNILIKRHGHNTEKKDNDSFPVPAVVLYGWFASVIVFIGEVVWKKYIISKVRGILYGRCRIKNMTRNEESFS